MAQQPKPGWLAKVFSVIGLVLLAVGYWADRPVGAYLGHELWLVDVMPVLIVVPFGIWRLATEREPYQYVRLSTILGLYLLLWVAIPMFFNPLVPRLGGAPEQFPAIHVIGSLNFFLYGAAMVLFGKRIDCGWNCPCVTARETVGFAFRDVTPRGKLWWNLRWLKWAPGGLILIFVVLLQIRPDVAYPWAGRPFYLYVANTYFYSFLVVPLLGNRSYCRWLCPYAAFWGWLSYIGLYRVKANKDLCTSCHSCEQVCDMGIPITEMVTRAGEVKTVECMGCGRCVDKCPNGVLRIESAAKWWLSQDEPAGTSH